MDVFPLNKTLDERDEMVRSRIINQLYDLSKRLQELDLSLSVKNMNDLSSIVSKNKAQISNLIDQITDEMNQRTSKLPEYLSIQENSKVVNSEFLHNVLETIERNIDNANLNINMLAMELGVSRTGLYRKLKEVTDLSANQIITKARLMKAAELLRLGLYTVLEVSIMVGFNDVKYFSKQFKKVYHMGPRKYSKLEQWKYE